MASPVPADRKVACNICRRKKIACDRVRPKCGLCLKNDFSCEYAEHGRQPGLRAGYVHQLEQRIDLLEQRLSSVESQLPNPNVQSSVNLNGDTDTNDYDGMQCQPESPTNAGSGVQVPGPSIDAYDVNDTSPGSIAQTQAGSISIGSVLNEPCSMHMLSGSVVPELCRVWFQKYHRWFPILHQPSFSRLPEGPNNIPVCNYGLVIQAIVAVTLEHSQILSMNSTHIQRCQQQLSTSVVSECMRSPSLQSVQALLILSILHYGDGKSMLSWNLLAMSRRMSGHLGLGAAIDRNDSTASSPTALRRLPMFTNTVITHEENIRAYWMIETLESISTIGARYELGLSSTPGVPLLPCSDSFWAYPETAMREHNVRPYHYCSAFSLCVILATSELSHVHRFLRKPVAMDNFEERDAWQSEAQRLDERLTAWRDEFVAAVFRLINAEYAHHERPEMDAYVVLTNCVLNTAVITLLQQRAPCPEGIDQVVEPWAFASNRCVYACENTAFKVRQMDEEELLFCPPHLIASIFVAARFYIVHSKALDANVPTNLHSLAFALHTCGKRWPLARMYERIIRIAVAEYRTPIALSRVPHDFFDLRLTTFEIADALVAWAEGPAAEVNVVMDGDHNGTMTFTPMAVNALA